MPPKFLEHALILTHDPIATRDWWRDALGLGEGDAPDFGVPVHWLYVGDQDVVHIAPAGGSAAQNAYLGNEAGGPAMGSGRLDHICFNCDGVEEAFARLDASVPNMKSGGLEHHPSIRCSSKSRSMA